MTGLAPVPGRATMAWPGVAISTPGQACCRRRSSAARKVGFPDGDWPSLAQDRVAGLTLTPNSYDDSRMRVAARLDGPFGLPRVTSAR